MANGVRNGLNGGKGKQIQSVPGKSKGWLGFIWLPMGLLLAVSAGALTGVIVSYYFNNSHFTTEVSALAHYRPSTVTKIYASDNETVIGEFAIQKRIPIKEKDIPPVVEDALLSIEDVRFYDHIGIDPYRMGGVLVKYVTGGRTEGASTLTQQLARGLFLTNEQTMTRKFNEWMLSLQIERFYTKRQILEMYMNHIFMGANSYGFEAASQTYFKKSLKDVTLDEAALLAAIPKSGSEYAPTRNMDKALERRNLVLDQMARYGKVTQAEADAAKAKPIKLVDTAYYQSQPKSAVTDYPVEDIRKYLEDKYTTRVAQGGLQVYTTIDVEAQKLATKAVRDHLRAYDKGQRWRSDYQSILVDDDNNPITDPKAIQSKMNIYKHPDWYGDDYETDDYVKGLVTKIDTAKNEAEVRFGRFKAIVRSGDMGRSGRSPAQELKVGLVPEFHVKKVDAENKTLEVELSQVPEVQAAIMTINAHTGEIVAEVGGYDFASSKFNCATQALRQTGSSYKPYIYTAAVEWGMTPDMLVSGAPIKKGGWQPHNYDGSLSHPNVPMKIALAKSYNIAAVHLLEMVGIQTGVQMVRRFGITNPMVPALPSALGASEASLIDMVSAYSTFPNKGVRVQPHAIRKVLNRDGTVLEEWEKTTYKVTSEYAALTMVEMMRGVTAGGGTASSASAGGQPIAGKTGTVNDHTDVWFIGYTPTYVTGVWMGNPERKESLGANMTGGHGAVPFFNSFMIPFMKDKPRESFVGPPPMPSDVRAMQDQRKREELEKLEKAELAGKAIDSSYTGDKTITDPTAGTELGKPPVTTDTGDDKETPPVTQPKNNGEEPPKQPEIKRPETVKTPQPEKTPPAGTKKKGKKGGDDNN
jgi:penicillin-binding protein 1A